MGKGRSRIQTDGLNENPIRSRERGPTHWQEKQKKFVWSKQGYRSTSTNVTVQKYDKATKKLLKAKKKQRYHRAIRYGGSGPMNQTDKDRRRAARKIQRDKSRAEKKRAKGMKMPVKNDKTSLENKG